MERTILHVDVNNAFLSWEAVYRLKHLGGTQDLRKIPSAVGGDITKRHGIILAKSMPAKQYQIKTGESVVEALQKCAALKIVPPNYNLYEKSSKALLKLLREYTDSVEQYSIDEAFCDISGTEKLYGRPVLAATEIKDRIYQELGFSVNIGISNNKVLAKMASDFKKPNRVHTLYPKEIEKKLWPLPVSELFFVGRATTKKLLTLGIETIGELAGADPQLLKAHLKKQGELIYGFAHGIDIAQVETKPIPNQGYGNSTTVHHDLLRMEEVKLVLLSLSESLGRRLRRDAVKIKQVSVSIKYDDFSYMSHQCLLQTATNITNEIHETACQLFLQLWDGRPVRNLGIHTGRISDHESDRQLSLFDQNPEYYEKQEKLDAAVDCIRDRFGMDAVQRAAFLKSDLDHMGGGITREKRSVDYRKEKVV